MADFAISFEVAPDRAGRLVIDSYAPSVSAIRQLRMLLDRLDNQCAPLLAGQLTLRIVTSEGRGGAEGLRRHTVHRHVNAKERALRQAKLKLNS